MAKVHNPSISRSPKNHGAPITMQQYESSPMDRARDKGYKEGSAADTKADIAAVKRLNKKY